MLGRSTIPADRKRHSGGCSHARPRLVCSRLVCGIILSGVLLVAAGWPSLAAAQQPRPSSAGQRGESPAPAHRPAAPASRPGPPPSPFAPPQGYLATPPPRRPLITAQPLSPAPQNSPENSGQGYPARRNPYAPPPPANLGRGNQQHLPGWLQSHSGQSFASQEQSLRQEPGFNRLPQPQQQRLIDRLHQLDTMPPQRRERTLGRIENLERLSPERRQQVRSSAQELSAMPEERRAQVRGAFRSLRDLPPEEREQQLNSAAARGQYTEHERQILSNLLSVEPYQPR